jgi:ribonuclease-3
LSEIESSIGYVFRDRRLLERALTHSSLVAGGRRSDRGFDRLEFLGDRVLGLVVADALEAAFPADDEGEIARRFAALVSAPSLAAIAVEIGLPRALRVSVSEGPGEVAKPSVLADAFEALMGAVYRDGGFAAAVTVLSARFAPRIAAMREPPRDPKTALQEWAQARALGLPSYRLLSATGPSHAPEFRVEVEVEGERASGSGSAKRIAERAAAAALLGRLEMS